MLKQFAVSVLCADYVDHSESRASALCMCALLSFDMI